ncbi:16S rRNA (uracil(1498)-N(3))-methyltransferase [Rhodococcus sp. BP-252]|uniref:16S rRNA (uracil(1498)-N(3))-methyltransferase n=1 Tax=unclassified Rhodococcus (in: high G+C Gram-positive bacteria) TaxID=192944 RepID=UPI001C9ACBE3|nr:MULTISPECIES: 16S rRNA (uracil(1498)-N(3))-methyltransferase [unclassified Rhodococcus (in: high G+C Gram-positive bacteria)]MBY6412033.1 16S rRNA (uracil(1498)-N(3))-methyltransferase [Rhodococcus sp. BP-320]MBY6416613.1 16S rRNA (uracil(1498)-N(3))-methyltransferase [Rhodococcus sp. BP-321]MBY6421198.1 16S rRNA (uracil(1498)-N(3))-methyltransferase [Rhodococcus sp. BP-324]MBY6426637.1 16S rRNA (uracil(1498)-N(3))-methyltransferase [Rhodococcus sp. BP-323]MBY6431636.1 16S rRNA (uracil(1498
MAATVFYLDPLPDVGGTAVLDGKEGRHAATVRRIRVGERILLSDGHGGIAETVVTAAERDRLEMAVETRSDVPRPTPSVGVVQALPKADRSELAVELATEAGIDSIVPWQSSRCVAKWEGAKADKGVARWQSVATAAAKQSRRPFVPEVAPLHTNSAVVALARGVVERGGIVAVLHEAASVPFSSLSFREVPEVLLVVGPEGGLTDSEVAALTGVGATPVMLGPTVLRTSTAAAVALGALGVMTNRWAQAPLDFQATR